MPKIGEAVKNDLKNLRDCVKKAFYEGSERGGEFRKMRHAIILELKRLGYDSAEIKDKLLEWNQRCERPLSLNEQKTQLFGYVDWVDKRDCKIGCNALEDYCIGRKKCKFFFMTNYKNRLETENLPFDLDELYKFLEERFKADGYVMKLIIKALRYFQQEKATGQVIFIGYKTISSIIRDNYGHNIDQMSIFRKVQLLKEEGIIEQLVKGKSGNYTKQANGYIFHPWARSAQ